jgi:hypothetical protein
MTTRHKRPYRAITTVRCPTLTGFDDKIVAIYARSMTIREIQAFLVEQNAPEFISSVH